MPSQRVKENNFAKGKWETRQENGMQSSGNRKEGGRLENLRYVIEFQCPA